MARRVGVTISKILVCYNLRMVYQHNTVQLTKSLCVLVLVMLCSGTMGGITDYYCTEYVGGGSKFYTRDVKVATDEDRIEKCFKLGNNFDPDLVQAAINFCLRTCGTAASHQSSIVKTNDGHGFETFDEGETWRNDAKNRRRRWPLS
ncbi:hypothetical protein KIN20_003294 [Parelaphostrongylus tenuis]|uniref:Uncharacterized protein n=1 Tax=Parelaphostrongylus tenuis TaxID=148309 RepID=A0AAD5LX33_PARTN|nr:hypothetical protein KIN20_003294 [Parelaphostrongylus tenuis]